MKKSHPWPDKVGRYEIRGLIGKGSMGKVYLAFDPLIGRDVAIKLMTFTVNMNAHQREKFTRRFLTEARAGGRIHHPNIVQVFDVGFEGEIPFIVMECVRGITLYELVKKNRMVKPEEGVDIGVQVCEALEAAHSAGVLHRDVKPTNILVAQDGQVKLVDLGVAKIEDSTTTETGETWGSPAYMSPEQLKGEPLDRRTDIFSLGATLYFALTGKKPFNGDTVGEVVEKILHRDPTPPHKLNPEIPISLSSTVMKCLNKERDERFSSALQLKEALLRAASPRSVTDVDEMMEASEHFDSYSGSYRIFVEKTSHLRRKTRDKKGQGLWKKIVHLFSG